MIVNILIIAYLIFSGIQIYKMYKKRDYKTLLTIATSILFIVILSWFTNFMEWNTHNEACSSFDMYGCND